MGTELPRAKGNGTTLYRQIAMSYTVVGSSCQQDESPERVAVINCEGKLEEIMVVWPGTDRIPIGQGKLVWWRSEFSLSTP